MRGRSPRDWRKKRRQRLNGERRSKEAEPARQARRAPPAGEWLVAFLGKDEPQSMAGLLAGPSHGEGRALGTYVSSAMRRIRSVLLTLIKNKAGLFLVTGSPGLGKSYLARWLAAELRAGGHRVVLIDRPEITLPQLYGCLLRELQHDAAEDAQTCLRLLRESAASHRQRALPMLLLDDADLAGDGLLLGLVPLLEAPAEPGRGFRIVLLGRPALAERLRAPVLSRLQQRIAYRGKLERLDEHEIALLMREEMGAPAWARCRTRHELVAALTHHAAGLPAQAQFLWSEAQRLAAAEAQATPSRAHVEDAARQLRPRFHRAQPLAPAAPRRERAHPVLRRARFHARAAAWASLRQGGIVLGRARAASARNAGWALGGIAVAALLLMVAMPPTGIETPPVVPPTLEMARQSPAPQIEKHDAMPPSAATQSESNDAASQTPPIAQETTPDRSRAAQPVPRPEPRAPMIAQRAPRDEAPPSPPEQLPVAPAPSYTVGGVPLDQARIAQAVPLSELPSAGTAVEAPETPPASPPVTIAEAEASPTELRESKANARVASEHAAAQHEKRRAKHEPESKTKRRVQVASRTPPASPAAAEPKPAPSATPALVAEPAAPPKAEPPVGKPLEIAMAGATGGPHCVAYRSNVTFALSASAVHGVACRNADGQWWLMDQKPG